MNKKLIRVFSSIPLLLPILLFILILLSPKIINAAPVTELKDSLSTAQLSYFARLGTGNATNDSIITINTDSGTNPSSTTDNLFIGDTIAIGNTSTTGSTLYIINDIGNTANISLTTGIGSSNVTAGLYVVATRSAVHTVSFKPQTSVAGGTWQVLIKATGISSETPADGMPDQGGFDLGALTAGDVTCPWGATASVGTTVNITSGVGTGATGPYHIINCDLTIGVTNPIDETGTITIGSTNKLINPAPALGHTLGKADGSADTYTIIVRHLDSDDSTVITGDTTLGKIAVVENVRVTAVVDPTITFYLDNTNVSSVGTTRCGTPISSGASQTTATSVSFGTLSLGTFNTLAQRFSCTTNAKNGYVVQVYENSQLSTSLGTTIPDTNCDGACSIDGEAEWDTDTGSTNSEFGYSLESISSSPIEFEASTNFTAKPFGAGSANARTIMSRDVVPSTIDQAYICYRITASNYQEAGTYQTAINFVATATF
ncbi:MAG: hypothetical protein WDA13_02135 [Candidatus Shapirobacteria bacterium]